MNIRKHLRRTPWHFYAAMLAVLLWAVVLGIYIGEYAAQAASEASCEPEMVAIEPAQPVAVLADASVEEDEILDDVPAYTDDDLRTLAIIIYQEAGADYCSDDTRLKVGTVVLNRVASDAYPDTIQDVAMQRKQYGRLYWTGLVWPERAQDPAEAHAVERAYNCAEQLLQGFRALPEDVVYQAEFSQGTEVVAHQDGLYFCR